MGRQDPGGAAGADAGAAEPGPDKQFLEIAKLAGLQHWAAMRGVPHGQKHACLTNEAEINRLVQMNSDATTQYPDFHGTPTFLINGKMVEQGRDLGRARAAAQGALGG